MQRLISTSDVGRPRACVQGVSGTWHVGLWLRCVLPARNDRLRGASSPHSTAGVYKFIMPSSGIRNRVRVRGFFSRIRPKPPAYQILRTVTTLTPTTIFKLKKNVSYRIHTSYSLLWQIVVCFIFCLPFCHFFVPRYRPWFDWLIVW